MTAVLPPNLLRLFEPRPPLPYVKPLREDATLVREKRPSAMSVGWILEELREEAALKEAEQGAAERTAVEVKDEEMATATADDEGAQPGAAKKEDGEAAEDDDAELGEVVEDDPPKPLLAASATPATSAAQDTLKQLDGVHVDDDGVQFTYTEAEKYRLRQIERKRLREENAARAIKEFDPQQDREAVGDPYRTLFISRLSYAATEEDLRREFNMYGPIERIRLVREITGKKKGKSRGYAFILYEREKDMKAAYKDAEGIKILGRRILVDVERGRTVKGWKPRRLGGGLGGRPKPVPVEAPAPFAPGGGFRGGPRGGGFGGGRGGGFGRGGGRGGFNDRPFGDRGPPGGGRGGGIGFSSRGGFGGGDRGFGGGDRGSPAGNFGGGGNFNQKDLMGSRGTGWQGRGAGGPPMQNGGYEQQRGPPGGDRGSAYGGGSFEVPRQGSGYSGGGGGYDRRY